jgi:hypothetical protein
MTRPEVDENLFYKGVDKSKVHGARLQQHNSEPVKDQSYSCETEEPPYPFDTGNTLLALTKKHNVGSIFASPFSDSIRPSR